MWQSHSDDGSITILLQGDVPGLQVQRGDKWLTVQTIPDALVVNVGNMLQVSTQIEVTRS
jgi:isopenicillin N synthase-like dioxygenase